jgi:hypothetical protein
MRLDPASLLSLEAYARERPRIRAGLIAHRRLRSLPLGPNMTLQFEDERTIRYQIQEMLRIEKIFEPSAIQSEIDAYSGLIPDGGNWMATLLIEYPDPAERERELARLLGVEHRLRAEIDGQPPLPAIADEDVARGSASRTSAVHYLRFEIPAAAIAALHAGAGLRFVCDHRAYAAANTPEPATRAALLQDFPPNAPC